VGTWQLFVDESGQFTPGAVGVVAGLLVCGRDTDAALAALRALLAQATPNVTWPPHASTLNIAGSWAVFAADGAKAAIDALNRRHAIADAEAERRALVVKLEDARTRGGWNPPDRRVRAVMTEVDRWLQRHARAAYGALLKLRDENERLRAEAQRDLGGCYGGSCVAAGAWGRSDDPGEQPADVDAYLQRLATLVERAAAALRLIDTTTRHTLLVYVAARDIETRGGPVPMTTAHLRRTFELVTRPRVSPAITVDLVPMPPQRYDHRVHPGIVVADHLANRMAYELSLSAQRDWSQVSTRVDDATGLPCELRTRAGDLPLIAADGVFASALRSRWHGDPAPPVPAVPPWAREQYDVWRAATGEAAP
jgi:hypothetical protein